jgi:hypothetical protein
LDISITGTVDMIGDFFAGQRSNIENGGGNYKVYVDMTGDDGWWVEEYFEAYLPYLGLSSGSTTTIHTNGHVTLAYWLEGSGQSGQPLPDSLSIKVNGGTSCSPLADYWGSEYVTFDNEGRCVVLLPSEVTSIDEAKAFLNGRVVTDSDVLFAYNVGQYGGPYTATGYWTAAELGVSDEWVEVETPVADTTNSDIYVADEALLDKITYSAARRVMSSSGAVQLGATNLTTGLDDFGVVFADVSKNNFRIDEESPLFGTGTLISGVTVDIAGVRRTSNDIGAYTYDLNNDDLGVPNTGFFGFMGSDRSMVVAGSVVVTGLLLSLVIVLTRRGLSSRRLSAISRHATRHASGLKIRRF